MIFYAIALFDVVGINHFFQPYCILNDVFSLQNEVYEGNWMYANVASAVSHYPVNATAGEDVCDKNNKYKWMVFYADCEDRWYMLKAKIIKN